jgi:tRNA nucleotidyltransferase/poly(A) polymerase
LATALELLRARIEDLTEIKKLQGLTFPGKVYLVGGAIRELALGQTPKDYDLVLERPEDATKLEELFQTKGFLLGKKPIQTYRIVAAGAIFDLTFLPNRIDQDLARRDFTMNAIAYELFSREIFDPFGGLEDIRRRLIRYPRREALKEDPLRMVKAVRHLSTLQDFSLDPELSGAITEDGELIRRAAPERIRYELDLIMLSQNPHRGVVALQETGLLFLLFPELAALREMDEEKGFELLTLGHTIEGFSYIARAGRMYPFDEQEIKRAAYGLLFHDLGKAHTFSYDESKERVHFFNHEKYSMNLADAIMERLRFSGNEIKAISKLIEHHMRIFLISNKEATEKAVRRLVYRMEGLTPALVLLTLLDMYGSSNGEENATTQRVRERCAEVLAAYGEWRKGPLPRLLNGHDLISLGFAQGSELGWVLGDIREKQVAGEITDKDAALEHARQFLKNTQ